MKKPHTQACPPDTAATGLLVPPSTGQSAVNPLPLEPVGRVHPRHILVPTDFSAASKKAIEYADAFASTFQSRVTLLHVLEPMILPPEYGYIPAYSPEDESLQVDAARRQLLETASSMDSAHQTEVLIRVGRPWHKVLSAVLELGIDLLVITTHGRTGLPHMLNGKCG